MADPFEPIPSPSPTPTPAPAADSAPPSLAELSRQTRPAPRPSPTPAPVRGDDLMVKAQAAQSPGEDDLATANLFWQSKQVVDSKMQEDPAYGEAVMRRLQKHEGGDLVHAMIDEADQIKIDFLKKQDPTRFNSAEAAKAAALNTTTFGQMTRIMGAVGVAAQKLSDLTGGAITAPNIQGQSYEDIVREQGEKFRLLQKAFPKSTIAGDAAAMLIPGSPAKLLFEKVAGVAAKGTNELLTRMANNPAFLQKIVSSVGNTGFEVGAKALESGAAGGAGAGAYGFIQGTLGKDLQGISFDRGAETGLMSAAGGGALGALLPVAGAVVNKVRGAVSPDVQFVTGKVRDQVAGSIEQLTGTDAEALRAFNARPQAIKEAAGSESEIGKNLVDFLQSHKTSPLPEVQLAKEILPELPDVNGQPLLDFLRSHKPGLNPALDPQIKILNEWADRIEAAYPNRTAGGQFKVRSVDIPAPKMREIVDDLQSSVREQFGKDSPFLSTALKKASYIARDSIVGTAMQDVKAIARPGLGASQQNQLIDALAGSEGAADLSKFLKPGVTDEALQAAKNSAIYTRLMEKAAEKRDVLKFIGKQLGSSEEMQARNAEGFIKRLFGSNKEVVRARLADLDSKFGTNFTELAQNANFASQLGPKGSPSLFSNLPTGKALVGTVTGGAVGGPVGGAVGAIVSSPRLGGAILGASDKITGFVSRMVQEPKILERIAAAPNPYEVRRLAQAITKTLTKDGPISAAGVTRLIADTPYFVGLVHAFDVAQRKQQQKTVNAYAARLQQQSAAPSQIANPQTAPTPGAQ